MPRLPGKRQSQLLRKDRTGTSPFAGFADGVPSLSGPSGAAMMMNRCQVPLVSPWEITLPTLRNQRVM